MSERRTSSPKECMLTSNERVILDQPWCERVYAATVASVENEGESQRWLEVFTGSSVPPYVLARRPIASSPLTDPDVFVSNKNSDRDRNGLR